MWSQLARQVPTTFLVLLLYWLLVFDGRLNSITSPLTHGANFIIAVADAFLSKQVLASLTSLRASLPLSFLCAGGRNEGDRCSSLGSDALFLHPSYPMRTPDCSGCPILPTPALHCPV